MSETMKKRYEDVSATLCAIHGLKYSHCLTREEAEAIESLLDDLMAERGKKKELLSNTQQFIPNCQELLDRSIDIVDEMEVGSFTEEMAQELRDTLTMLLGNQNKPVNLDELFPPEIMEKAKSIRVEGLGSHAWGEEAKESLISLLVDEDSLIDGILTGAEVEFVAYPDFPGSRKMKELARVRVRLGLTVEIVEDK